MDDNENIPSGLVPRLVGELMGQLRAATGRLEDLTRFSGGLPPAPGSLPLPGGLSATQMASITDSIAAQRRSIAALQAQLLSFDEQLEVLEQMLGPLAGWSRSWADLEQRLLNMGRRPGAEGEAEGEGAQLTAVILEADALRQLLVTVRAGRHTADADVGDDRGDRGLDRRLVSHRGVADDDPRRVTSFGRRP